MVVRYTFKESVIVRPVLGIELFSVIGWHFNFWRDGKYPDGLLSNMAGNAFSAFAFLPMIMTAVAGQGVLCELVEEQIQMAQSSVKVVVPIQDSSSSQSS